MSTGPTPSEAFARLITYWPARTGMWWWDDFRRDEIVADLDAVASLGISHLMIYLTWVNFQPDRARIATRPLRQLELVLQQAWDRSIAVSCTLFPIRVGDTAWVPTWALDNRAGDRPVIAGHYSTRRAVRNLFEDPLVVGAQEKLASEIAGAFRGHPALAGWAIGRGMTTAGGPSSREAWIHWLSVMSQAFQQASVPVFVGLDAGDVIRNSRMGPDELARLGLSALVSDNWRPEWARNVEAWPAFLAAYTSALAGSPALLEVAAGDAAQQERSLEGTWRNGGMGAVSPPLLDFLPSLAAVAPFAERPDLLTSGLLDLERQPKEEGLVWLGFGRRELRSLPSRILVADPERREHDPEQGARESFEEFSR